MNSSILMKISPQQVDGAADRWSAVPIVEDLKAKAKAEGLWNLFLAGSEFGPGLSNLDYAPLAEIMGRVTWSSEIFNCSPPDAGNMETIERYGTPEQKKRSEEHTSELQSLQRNQYAVS